MIVICGGVQKYLVDIKYVVALNVCESVTFN